MCKRNYSRNKVYVYKNLRLVSTCWLSLVIFLDSVRLKKNFFQILPIFYNQIDFSFCQNCIPSRHFWTKMMTTNFKNIFLHTGIQLNNLSFKYILWILRPTKEKLYNFWGLVCLTFHFVYLIFNFPKNCQDEGGFFFIYSRFRFDGPLCVIGQHHTQYSWFVKYCDKLLKKHIEIKVVTIYMEGLTLQ